MSKLLLPLAASRLQRRRFSSVKIREAATSGKENSSRSFPIAIIGFEVYTFSYGNLRTTR
jgi:hypothetical protein